VASAVLLAIFVVSQLVQSKPMFDLSLLRKPTFTGGLIAAFGVSASIFSLLTFLVIYVQNVLDYSAVETGVRLLFLSGASFFAAAIAGRLTERVPVKWLIAPGFLILGVGLLLILGIQTDSSWTHLIPGLTVAGIGIGMINPPLASTAVGVVPVARSGMASGVNSTFRQVGIATGIAALGSIFSQQVADAVRPDLAGKVPASALDGLTGALSGGQVQAAAEGAQKAAQASGGQGAGKQAFDLVNGVGTSAVVDALNHVVLIAAVIAFVSGLLCLFLIRQKDFVVRGGPPAPEAVATDSRDKVPAGEHLGEPVTSEADLPEGGAHAARTHRA
jgi:hypothetical protein